MPEIRSITIGSIIKEEEINPGLFEQDMWNRWANEEGACKTEIHSIIRGGESAEGATCTAWYVCGGEHDKKIVKLPRKEKISDFLKQHKIIRTIYSTYLSQHTNLPMFSHPELYKSSLGPIYLTEPTARVSDDATLEDYVTNGIYIKDNVQRLKEALILGLKIIEDLEVYHHCGYANLDLKPENLLKINTSEDDFVVRNLDFGSCVPCKSIIDEINSARSELAQSEDKEYLREQKKCDIWSSLFKSTEAFYPSDAIKQMIDACLKCDSDEKIKRIIFNMDIRAIINIIRFYYFGEAGSSIDNLQKLCAQWLNDDSPNSLEEYEIFYRFRDLIFNSGLKYDYNGEQTLQVIQIKQSIEQILDILKPNIGTQAWFYNCNLRGLNRLLHNLTGEKLNREVKGDNGQICKLRYLIRRAAISPALLAQELMNDD